MKGLNPGYLLKSFLLYSEIFDLWQKSKQVWFTMCLGFVAFVQKHNIFILFEKKIEETIAIFLSYSFEQCLILRREALLA